MMLVTSTAIARLLIDHVVVNVEGHSEQVDFDIHWQEGFESHHVFRRPVQTNGQLSYYDELLARIQTLLAEGKSLEPQSKTTNFHVDGLVARAGNPIRQFLGLAVLHEVSEFLRQVHGSRQRWAMVADRFHQSLFLLIQVRALLKPSPQRCIR